jgi:hypothetical protein
VSAPPPRATARLVTTPLGAPPGPTIVTASDACPRRTALIAARAGRLRAAAPRAIARLVTTPLGAPPGRTIVTACLRRTAVIAAIGAGRKARA